MASAELFNFLYESDRRGKRLASVGLPAGAQHILGNSIAIEIKSVDFLLFKGSVFVHAFNNVFVEHRLAELSGLLLVGDNEVDNPIVD